MKKSVYQLNQYHWRYAVKITNGLSEERMWDDTEDESYEEAFEGNEFDEDLDDYFFERVALAA